MTAMRESEIERRLARVVKHAGGLCLKFSSPNAPGVPDRVVILPGGRVVFIELKTAAGRLSRIQRWMLAEMRARGADVRVLYGADDVDRFVSEAVCWPAAPPNAVCAYPVVGRDFRGADGQSVAPETKEVALDGI